MGELHLKYQQRLAETTSLHGTELTNLRTGYDAVAADNNGLPFSTLCYYPCCIAKFAFSALTLLVGLQEVHPACKKTGWWSAGVVICLERGAELHMAQMMPMPLTVCCFSKIQIGFTFLIPAHPRSPGLRAVKRVCVLHRNISSTDTLQCCFICFLCCPRNPQNLSQSFHLKGVKTCFFIFF